MLDGDKSSPAQRKPSARLRTAHDQSSLSLNPPTDFGGLFSSAKDFEGVFCLQLTVLRLARRPVSQACDIFMATRCACTANPADRSSAAPAVVRMSWW